MGSKVALRKRLGQLHGGSNLLGAEADLAEIYVGKWILGDSHVVGGCEGFLSHALMLIFGWTGLGGRLGLESVVALWVSLLLL